MKSVVLPFQHPFMLTLCGPSQSGKTYWIYNLINHIDCMIKPVPLKIVYLYTKYQEIYDKMKNVVVERKSYSNLKEIEFVNCFKAIPTSSELKAKIGESSLVIYDDLMTTAASSSQNIMNLDNIASRDSHHDNMSVIFVCQNLMYGNGKLRNIRVNSQYHVIFKNLSDFRNAQLVASNRKIDSCVFSKILSEINDKQYGYLVFDGSPNGCNNTRLRTNIFPNECTTIYDV